MATIKKRPVRERLLLTLCDKRCTKETNEKTVTEINKGRKYCAQVIINNIFSLSDSEKNKENPVIMGFKNGPG